MASSFSIIQLVLSMLLFLVMFFGIGFLINMLLRSTWFMAFVYPIVVIFIVDDVSFLDYFFKPGTAFPALGDKLVSLQLVDILILASGLAGAIIAGLVMKGLRKNGYRMF
ncbi:YuiB family protein [Viridibacillus sp. YIM B01967]|uniref:YuiB family protein n=1 Tax=Viridibacillus soli TaxID=2798301 RepID=A0ABS1H9T0_9BACL|nr:YuiB family protein [Viridibacillus soli]MBK3496178.1 YuiB family protein [Viridibacillus soli]